MKIRAEISYLGGEFNFKVKYLCFTVFPFKKKEKNKKNKKKSTVSTAVSQEQQADKQDDAVQSDELNQVDDDLNESKEKSKSKETLSEKINKIFEILEKVKIIWSVSKKWLAHILKHIYIEELMIDFLITDEDAYDAAMNYGKINAAIYNLINLIRTFFTVTIKTVDILCDFDAEKSIYDISAKITVRPATILRAVFAILFGLLINIKKLIGKNNREQSSDKKVVSM